MVYWLLGFLQVYCGVKVPSVFFYTSTRMLLAAMTTLLITIFAGPYFIRKLYQLKIGQTIRMEECPQLGELHAKKKDTPTMGGLLILFSLLISALLWMQLNQIFTWLLLITALSLGALGALDDYLKLRYKSTKGLSGKKKILGQLLLSLLIGSYLYIPAVSQWADSSLHLHPPSVKESIAEKPLTLEEYTSRIYVPFFKDPLVGDSWIWLVALFLLAIFVIMGSSNSVNLTDGLDGLAAGCLLMVACSLAIVAFLSNHIALAGYLNIPYVEGSGEVAIFLSALMGACLGFLWYNGHPAQLFMGDTGSLALGGVIGVAALLLKRELLLGIIGGVFVAEALSVILQVASFRLRNKRRVFLCAPLHHHFEYRGWPETKVVLRFWIVALLLAMVGMISIKMQ